MKGVLGFWGAIRQLSFAGVSWFSYVLLPKTPKPRERSEVIPLIEFNHYLLLGLKLEEAGRRSQSGLLGRDRLLRPRERREALAQGLSAALGDLGEDVVFERRHQLIAFELV